MSQRSLCKNVRVFGCLPFQFSHFTQLLESPSKNYLYPHGELLLFLLPILLELFLAPNAKNLATSRSRSTLLLPFAGRRQLLVAVRWPTHMDRRRSSRPDADDECDVSTGSVLLGRFLPLYPNSDSYSTRRLATSLPPNSCWWLPNEILALHDKIRRPSGGELQKNLCLPIYRQFQSSSPPIVIFSSPLIPFGRTYLSKEGFAVGKLID